VLIEKEKPSYLGKENQNLVRHILRLGAIVLTEKAVGFKLK